MCTLPEMSGTECFVLVGVVHSCTRAAALLVQGAALQDLSGHALPCSTPCSLNSTCLLVRFLLQSLACQL